MRYKVTFAAGFAAGYVLGAKAGTQRYQQIENAWRRFLDTPQVQQVAGMVGGQAGSAMAQAKQTVTAKIPSMTHRPRSDARAAATDAGDNSAYPASEMT
jgi:hypothetical protein